MARLVVLCLVPVLGLIWLGTMRLRDLEVRVDEAEYVVQSTEMHRNVNAISQAAHTERLALSGVALADQMGVPRELVVEVSGIDLEEMFFDERSRLDDEMDELGRRLEIVGTADARGMRLRLDDVRDDLDRLRAESEQHQGDADALNDVFDRIDRIAIQAHDLFGLGDRHAGYLVKAEAQLDALLEVTLSANRYATAIMQGFVSFDGGRVLDVERARITHATRLDVFEHLVAAEQEDSVIELREAFGDASEPVDALLGTITLEVAPDPSLVTAAAAPLVEMFDYLGTLSDVSENLQQEIVVEAQSLVVEARREATETRLMLYAVGAVTLALILFVALSTVAPLRRLGRRAEAIGAGELALEPLPVTGPGIVRTLTATVNDMLSTLHLVDRQIAGMASGTLDRQRSEIPGTIGDSLRDSVDRLAGVTEQWQRSERRASAIVEQAADAIWAIDADGLVRTANEASERLLEVPADEQVGRPMSDFLSTIDGETRVKGRPDVRVHVASSVVIDPDHDVVVIARDLSERFRFEEQLAHQARHDPLTKLPNRFAVLERLEELYDAHESVAVLFVDVDGFKSVNDTRGHAVGDRVLAEIGARLASHVRPHDFVARLGGDEFVVLARGVDGVNDAAPFGRRLIEEIERPYVVDDSTLALSASIGVAVMDRTVPALETIRRADSAVYVAKRHGRGRVEAFDAQLQASIEHDADLALALRDAIRLDELLLHYQPIIDLATNEIAGVEALVRWDRPGYGLIPPDDFIPVAERSSLIVDLQRWVIREACGSLAEWRRRDPSFDTTVAINISGRHLIDGDLVADLDAAIGETGADSRLVVLELTETQLLEDVERAIEVLEEIRRRGVTISVDDFGTGYSSMTYLRDLPIDAIKIDRTFLATALADGQDEPLVDAMLTIGQSLDLAVVAEGVETTQQLDYVSERGCTYAQGYLFSPPLSIAEAEQLLFGSLAPVG